MKSSVRLRLHQLAHLRLALRRLIVLHLHQPRPGRLQLNQLAQRLLNDQLQLNELRSVRPRLNQLHLFVDHFVLHHYIDFVSPLVQLLLLLLLTEYV